MPRVRKDGVPCTANSCTPSGRSGSLSQPSGSFGLIDRAGILRSLGLWAIPDTWAENIRGQRYVFVLMVGHQLESIATPASTAPVVAAAPIT